MLHDHRRRAPLRRRARDRAGAHRGRQLHRHGRRHRRRSDDRRHRAATTSGPILPVLERLGVEVELGDDWVRVPPDQTLEISDDLGGAIPKIEDGPWPAFPADLTSIAVVVATQAAGHGADLREDVREPPVLRRQARLDGRADHPLRPAPRRRDAARRSSTASECRARTSAPGMAMVIAALCAEGTLDDRRRLPDRQGLRADRRAPARARRAHRARRGVR